MHWIPRALHCTAYSSVWREEGAFCVKDSPPPSHLYFPLFTSVMGACRVKGMGAHGWFVRFCQLSVQSPSWSWLPIVEAPGWLRYPTSTLATQLLIFLKTRQSGKNSALHCNKEDLFALSILVSLS